MQDKPGASACGHNPRPSVPEKADSMPSTRFSFMARYVVALLAVLVLAGAPPAYGQSADDRTGSDPVPMYVFKSATCPHCQEQKPFTDALAEANDRVTVDYYEIMRTDAHHDLLRKLAGAYDVKPGSVPMVFVGDRVWVGDSPEIRREIRQQVERCLKTGCPDPVAFAEAAGGTAELAEEDARIDLPLLGTVDLSVQPLLLSTSIIAFVDGFNPCSLWLLTILIALVLHSGSRKRVLIVGLVFLVTTAAVYGLFMVGVFSVLAYAQYLPWMYWIVAAFALLFGLVNVKDYFWFGKGLSFTIDDKYKPGIFKNFRELLTNGRSPLALAGATTVMALGIALIELPCTAGFPVIWSGLLSSHEVGATAFAGLLLVYLAIYLLDELVVFFIAVAKLRIERFQEGQARVLKLIGGVVMIALALVLVTEPELMSQPGPAIGVFVAAFAVTALIVLVHRQVLPRLGIRLGD